MTLREMWLNFLESTACKVKGHLWYYSDYKYMESKRGCFRCFKKETPATSVEFFNKIRDMEERALNDLREFTTLAKSGSTFREACEPIDRVYPDEWGPLAKDLP